MLSELIPFQSLYINGTPGLSGVTGTGSAFTVFIKGSQIAPKQGKTIKVAITTATIPLTYQGVNSTNNTLSITETNGVTPKTFTVTLTNGQYSAASFATMVNAVMNAASTASGYALAYASTVSVDTGLFTFIQGDVGYTTTINISSTTAIVPLGLDSTGANPSFTSVAPYTSPSIINIVGPTEIHIRCANFQSNIYETRVQGESTILAIIPIVGNQYDSVVYIPAFPKLFGFVGARVDRLDFFITDETGYIINLNGFGPKIQLAFYETA